MEPKTESLYPSASLENSDLEQRLEKKLNYVISFKTHINNMKEMITYFKDKNDKPKNRYKNYETPNTILKSVDTIVIIEATSTSIALSITVIGLNSLQIWAGRACTLKLGNKVIQNMFIN